MAKKPGTYRFSFGPWNISMGADPFGPVVRKEVQFAKKVREYKKLGFDYVQLHDDDVVPADWDAAQTARGVAKVKQMFNGEGVKGEFIAPRLWEDPRTIDGAYTANSAAARRYARDRTRRAIDIANMLDIDLMVLWPAREGTYIRESKDAVASIGLLVDAVNDMLEYPGDDMAYALWHGKLWGVHLNDQNGLKYDQDKTFGSVDLRRAFNQVWVLDRAGYYDMGVVGLDVKAMRTTKQADETRHLANSLQMFQRLLTLARTVDAAQVEGFRRDRDYEGLELYILEHLLGR
jgi:xylose isomerase